MTRYKHAARRTSNASGGAGAYEMTASGGANVHAPSHLAHDSHKQHNVAYGCGDGYEVAACDTPATAPPAPAQTAPAQTAPASNTRKRKASSYGTSSAYDEEVGGDDSSQSSQNASEKKQNHSEIEKRRRDKMNTYICELSNMIPMCGAMARKLDKLSVLRMAVAHLRSVRGALSACPLAARPLPAFLPRREVAARVLAAARPACLLVVGCDRGRLLYVSATINRMLHYHQSELLGQSLFDILHPKDVAKVKEQLSSPDLSPRERLVDAKTMLPVKPDVVSASCLCLGARRSFFCRIKCKSTPDDPAVKEDPEPAAKIRKKHSEKKYCVVHCTGYLKSWAPSELGESGGTSGTEEGELSSLSCLVAVGRALPDLVPAPTPPSTAPSSAPAPPSTAPARRVQYVSRHSPDGKFLFVDQRVTLALGFLPQELLGTSLYEYMAGPELAAVARTHKASLMRREPLHTTPYCFRKKDGTYAKITTHFKPFKNPWTKEVECLVANNTVVEQYAVPTPNPSPPYAFPPIYKTAEAGGEWARFPGEGEEMRRRIAAQVESHKIGAAIVQEALRGGGAASPDLPTDLLLDPAFPHQVSLVDSMFGSEACYGPTRASPPPMSSPVSPPLPPLDGNGEAAMAVIMSLLEADAGLGGPINFSGLPWPLP